VTEPTIPTAPDLQTGGSGLGLALPAEAAKDLEAAIVRARNERWAERLMNRDTSLWSSDERVRESISERLGWLASPRHFADHIADLDGFAEGIRDAGFQAAVVMGMGGSSLAPDMLHRTFGVADGYLPLRILDSTDPVAVAGTVDDLDPLSTLWIVASKSGTTTEPLAFQADAWARVDAALEQGHAHESPGELMVAITDPGRSEEAIPHHDDLRELFLNPPDIGGRYSALSYVGLVPAALIGLDLEALLGSALTMLAACHALEPSANPGVHLGLAIGTLARAGRDKLTFVADPEIATFGAWAEQLLAESTGKRGVGIVPVDLEPLGAVEVYGADRVFVRLSLVGSAGPDPAPDGTPADALLAGLEAAGHPVIRIGLADPIDVGGEFLRWEVATAIAGAVLGIDPFDQPNVEEAKELTRQVLATAGRSSRDGRGPGDRRGPAGEGVSSPSPVAAGDGITVYGDAALRLTGGDGTVSGELARHLARRRPGAYIALQAFIAPSPGADNALARIRTLVRDRTGCATTAGYGPRFLHSTGQLHKGGTPVGCFIQLTSGHPTDRPIPGWPYTFGQLIDAQALGDFGAIESHDLPIVRVDLGPDPEPGLAVLERALAAALMAPHG
jgi:glucose-6-phosphate isomerase